MAPQCGSLLLIIRFAFLNGPATAKCAHLRFHSSSRGVQRHISYFALLHILLCLSVDPRYLCRSVCFSHQVRLGKARV